MVERGMQRDNPKEFGGSLTSHAFYTYAENTLDYARTRAMEERGPELRRIERQIESARKIGIEIGPREETQ